MGHTVRYGIFEWDFDKNLSNAEKHGVGFEEASLVFWDPARVSRLDEHHSFAENRWFCIGRVGKRIITLRYVFRDQRVRIIGAGLWRKERKIYEKKIAKK